MRCVKDKTGSDQPDQKFSRLSAGFWGGKIIITLEDGKVEQEQTIDPKPSALLISIADNGPDVPPDKVSGLFKKFYQADPKATRKHGGTGLGLTICKEIVEMHGGKIWYETSYGKGACFRFLVPRLPPNSVNDVAGS